jgi:glycosyltransferase involved in cell wall biosynthesis
VPGTPSTRCRVLQIIPADGLGGVEAAARSMAARADLDCDFRLLPIAREVTFADTSRVIVPRDRTFTVRAYARALRNILREDPDVLVCSLWRSVPLALVAKRLRPRMKLALFVHSAFTTNIVDKKLNDLAMRRADAIWADSQATLDARVPASVRTPARVISFVTQRLERSRPVERPPAASFVSWGRLHHYKGVDDGLRLIARLVERGIDARFDVWGPDNNCLPELIALRKKLRLDDRVAFRGATDQKALPAIAREHSFYLQLSRFEGMAMAVVEGMQLGLVPVVTPVGEMPRYCRSGHNAVIVDVTNFDAAAGEIAGILADPATYRRLDENAAQHWTDAPLYSDIVCRAARNLMEA